MSSVGTSESSMLYRVLKTCYKLLRKRGYLVDDKNFNMTSEQFRAEYGAHVDRAAIQILTQKQNEPDDKIYVFFWGVEKLSQANVSEYYKKMKETDISRAILVISAPMTSAAKNMLKKFASKGARIEIFYDKELLVDITEHKLVPTHVLLTQLEKEELLRRYRLKESQLPRIQQVDPVARYLGLKPRDVVRIDRPSETAGRYITYRICI